MWEIFVFFASFSKKNILCLSPPPNLCRIGFKSLSLVVMLTLGQPIAAVAVGGVSPLGRVRATSSSHWYPRLSAVTAASRAAGGWGWGGGRLLIVGDYTWWARLGTALWGVEKNHRD